MADKATWKAYFKARAAWFKTSGRTSIHDYDKTGLIPKRPEGKPPRRKRRKSKRKRLGKKKGMRR